MSQEAAFVFPWRPIVLTGQTISASSHYFVKGLFADQTRPFTSWFSLRISHLRSI